VEAPEGALHADTSMPFINKKNSDFFIIARSSQSGYPIPCKGYQPRRAPKARRG
jgi:hypothetical protein